MQQQSSQRSTYISLFLATCTAMIGVGIIQPVMPLYAKNMGATGIMLGFIFGAFAVSRGTFAPLVGEYSDRYGRRRLMLSGLSFSVVFSISYAFVTDPTLLIIIRFMHGATSAMVTPVAQSYIGDIAPEGKEGKYVNLFFLSMFAGQAIGPTLGGVISEEFGLIAPFYALASMLFASLVLVYLFVPEMTALPKRGDVAQTDAAHSGEAPPQQKPSFIRNFSTVLRDTAMRGVLTRMASRAFYRWGFNAFFPILAALRLDMNPARIGLIISCYMMGSALLQFPAGLLHDRFPQLQRLFILGGSLGGAVMMFFVPLTSDFTLLFIISLAMGLATAVSRAGDIIIRTKRGRLLGMGIVTGALTTALSVGEVFGPLSFGVVMDFVNIDAAFYFGGIVGVIGALAGTCYFNDRHMPLIPHRSSRAKPASAGATTAQAAASHGQPEADASATVTPPSARA